MRKIRQVFCSALKKKARRAMWLAGACLLLLGTPMSVQAQSWQIDFVEEFSPVSIPLDGRNTAERAFTLVFRRMIGSNIAKFDVTVKSGGVSDSFEVTSADFDLSGVNVVIPVTYGAGSFPSKSPPANTVIYEIQGLSRTGNRSNILTSDPIPALWNVPNAWFSRFGKDARGGDDWAKASTWKWLSSQRRKKIIAALDNIAGEHGTPLVRRAHNDGTEVDALINPVIGTGIKNTKRKPSLRRKNAKAGSKQYDKLVSLAFEILNDNPTAEGQMRDWLDGQRSSLETLRGDRRIQNAEYLVGAPVKADGWELKRGWLSQVLCRGKLNALDSATAEKVIVKLGANRSRQLGCGKWLLKGKNDRLHLNIKG